MSEKGIKQRKRILDYITDYMLEKGYAPTLREICDGLGMKMSTAYCHMKIMADEGMIENDGGARAIRVPGYKIVKV